MTADVTRVAASELTVAEAGLKLTKTRIENFTGYEPWDAIGHKNRNDLLLSALVATSASTLKLLREQRAEQQEQFKRMIGAMEYTANVLQKLPVAVNTLTAGIEEIRKQPMALTAAVTAAQAQNGELLNAVRELSEAVMTASDFDEMLESQQKSQAVDAKRLAEQIRHNAAMESQVTVTPQVDTVTHDSLSHIGDLLQEISISLQGFSKQFVLTHDSQQEQQDLEDLLELVEAVGPNGDVEESEFDETWELKEDWEIEEEVEVVASETHEYVPVPASSKRYHWRVAAAVIQYLSTTLTEKTAFRVELQKRLCISCDFKYYIRHFIENYEIKGYDHRFTASHVRILPKLSTKASNALIYMLNNGPRECDGDIDLQRLVPVVGSAYSSSVDNVIAFVLNPPAQRNRTCGAYTQLELQCWALAGVLAVEGDDDATSYATLGAATRAYLKDNGVVQQLHTMQPSLPGIAEESRELITTS